MEKINLKSLVYLPLLVLLLTGTHKLFTRQIFAACNLDYTTSTTLGSNCGIDADSTEAYDISVGTDDATNSYVITVPNATTLTINSGVSTNSVLITGQVVVQTGGSVSIGSSQTQIKVGQKCYVTDSDGDTYANSTTCSATGGAGYIRKNKMTSTTADCCDSDANAKPGQTSYFTTARTTCGGYDYNCNSSEEQQNTSGVSFSTCVDVGGSCGYGTVGNSGWSGSVPACGAAGTWQDAGCCPYEVSDCPSAGQYPSCSIGGQFTSGQTQACR